MKSLTIVVLMILSAGLFAAPSIQWDASAGAEGYNVYCGAVPPGSPVPINAGDVLTYDLVAVVTPGTQYECWVTAYAAGLPESAESNHIQFTPPTMSQTITVPGQPSTVTISWQ